MKVRGLSRVFVALAVLWVAYCAFGLYGELSRLHRSTRWSVSNTEMGWGEAIFVFSAAQPVDEVRNEMKDNIAPDWDSNHEKYAGKVLSHHFESYIATHQMPMIQSSVERAFFGAAGILLVGWAITWVISGFRESR